jgi:hypothetical protein
MAGIRANANRCGALRSSNPLERLTHPRGLFVSYIHPTKNGRAMHLSNPTATCLARQIRLTFVVGRENKGRCQSGSRLISRERKNPLPAAEVGKNTHEIALASLQAARTTRFPLASAQ